MVGDCSPTIIGLFPKCVGINYLTAPPEFLRYNWIADAEVTTARKVAEVPSNTVMFPPPVMVQPVLVVTTVSKEVARFTIVNSNDVPTSSSTTASSTSAAVGRVKVVSSVGVATNNLLLSSCAAVGVAALVTATAVTFSFCATYAARRVRSIAPFVFDFSGIFFS